MTATRDVSNTAEAHANRTATIWAYEIHHATDLLQGDYGAIPPQLDAVRPACYSHTAKPAPTDAVVDDDPADLRHVYAWLAEQLGVDLPLPIKAFRGRSGNKRIRNQLLRASGWRPTVLDFRTGWSKPFANATGPRPGREAMTRVA